VESLIFYYLPRHHRVLGDAPFIFSIVEVGVADPTVQDLYGYIVYTVLPASN